MTIVMKGKKKIVIVFRNAQLVHNKVQNSIIKRKNKLYTKTCF